MENLASVWLLSGIGLIGFAIFSRRLSAGRYRAQIRLFKIALATAIFLLFFYSATIAMNLMYGLDSALLKF